jgi:hypothetical protein
MKLASASSMGDDLLPEYDESTFVNAVRGKYVEASNSGTNIVRLAPDVAADFPNEQTVNDALRFVQKVAQDASRRTKRSPPRPVCDS